MSLFTHHSLDETNGPNGSHAHLSKQLAVLSAHPTKPFHMSIGDLIQWLHSSTQKNKAPLAFLNEQLLRGLSPSSSLALLVDGIMNGSQPMFSGESKWLQSVLFDRKSFGNKSTPAAQVIFESMLSDEIKEMVSNKSPPAQSSSSPVQSDVDLHTIATCIQQFYTISCLDWSSLEVDVAARALVKLQEWEKSKESTTEECNEFVDTCSQKLLKIVTQVFTENESDFAMPSSSTKLLKLRKRRVQSQIDNETSKIKSLEDQLALEVDRLQQIKRVKQLFDAHLDMERHSPISVLTEEIRTSITPSPSMTPTMMDNATGFTYSLLDGAAEIVMKIPLDDEEVDGNSNSDSMLIELGCFIKDGGASIQLLQAILLGSLDMKVDESLGPFPLRQSLSKIILENDSREELFLQMSHIISRIDALVRSVRELESSQGFCSVKTTANGDVSFSISMSHEGTVVQIVFLFDNLLGNDWCVTTVPNSIKVSIVSSSEREDNLSLLKSQLQETAQSMLGGSSSSKNVDPILLRRICGRLFEMARMDS